MNPDKWPMLIKLSTKKTVSEAAAALQAAVPANQADAASFMILTIVSSTSCATPFSCGGLNIASRAVGFKLASMGFLSRLTSVFLLGCSGGLDHAIMFRFGDAFFDELFFIAPPLLILILAGSRRHFVSG